MRCTCGFFWVSEGIVVLSRCCWLGEASNYNTVYVVRTYLFTKDISLLVRLETSTAAATYIQHSHSQIEKEIGAWREGGRWLLKVHFNQPVVVGWNADVTCIASAADLVQQAQLMSLCCCKQSIFLPFSVFSDGPISCCYDSR